MPADEWALHFAVIEAHHAGEQQAEEEHEQVRSGARQPGTAAEREQARWDGFDDDVATAQAAGMVNGG